MMNRDVINSQNATAPTAMRAPTPSAFNEPSHRQPGRLNIHA
eukprot:CAMPEP_0184397410 /NCGR_PEP_ID=MMETSP0007-20130409/59858_1 /TAXON_ID=97485 /ORGANISM="Prymnesium parvum, Strain Texoma1" /LENGTH=41 /DNA_ID= /DNA_START= /DNA_END= /DNA_ORIENTATION=